MAKYGPPPQQDDTDVISQLVSHFRAVREKVKQVSRKNAQRNWKAKLTEPTGLTRTLAQAVRAESDKLLRTVRIAEGQTAMSISQVMDTLTQYWDGIHQLPEHDPHQWMEQIEPYLPPRREPVLAPITPEALRSRIKSTKLHAARGADGWSISELRSLPLQAMQQTTLLLVHSKWPDLFDTVLTAVLQKGSDPGPGDIRPIGVTPILYRAWAALRFQELQPWAERLYPAELTAYRHGIDLQAANLQKARRVERALLEGEDLFCLSFDLKKAFDHVPHEALLLLMHRLGLPAPVLGLLRHKLRHQVQRWKIFGAVASFKGVRSPACISTC